MIVTLIQFIFVYAATVGLAVLSNVPAKALNFAGIVGIIGYVAYSLFNNYLGSAIGADVFGAFSIGIAGMIAAKIKKMPVIVFDIPALVTLVPGTQAYEVAKNLALRNTGLALSFSLKIALISGALALGFIISELCIQLTYRLSSFVKKIYYQNNKDK